MSYISDVLHLIRLHEGRLRHLVLDSDRRVIVYMSDDGQYAAMLRCNEFDIHRECLHPVVTIFGKTTDYTDDVKAAVLQTLESLCVTADELTVYTHDSET